MFLRPSGDTIYSYNSVTAKKDEDGSVAIHFGGDPGSVNHLPITEGSLEDEFVHELSAASIYFLKDGDLYIDHQFDSGTMRFSK